jgi:hypothetical protein
MQTFRYESSHGPWHAEMHESPQWVLIEEAIRRLDRCLFPFIFLYHDEAAHEDGNPDLQVIGGRGEYAIDFHRPDGKWLTYIDATRRSIEVEIWESDQGSSRPEFELCPDLARTITAVRYYCETGELHPDMDWMEL